MPSTYTLNTGVEKPASGEQSGSWGSTVNTNMDILDRAINGVVTIPITGTTSTITTNDGSLSDGQNKLLIYTGTLAAAHTVTIDPADAQKIYYIQNNTNQTLTFTQGTGAQTAEVVAADFKIIYADGSDECRSLIGGNLKVGGVAVTTSGTELNLLTGLTAEAAEINLLDGAVGGTVVADKAAVYGSQGELAATTLELPENWKIKITGTGASSFLKVEYNGTEILSISTSGALVVENDITAFGSA